MIVDLSHPLEPGMPSYPGLPVPKFNVFLAHENAEVQAKYAPGTTFQIASHEFAANTGTYLDSPFHRHRDGLDLRDLPLECMVNLPGILVNEPGDGAIVANAFGGLSLAGAAVLVHTGWSVRWKHPEDYFRSGPFLTRDASEFLVAQRVALVGIDCANIDNMHDPSRPAHTMLLKAGIPIVEHLTNLAALDGRVFRFFAAPPAIVGGTSFPVRAFALCE
jgi:arylformamidase